VKPLLAVVGGHSAGGRRAGASHTAAAATPGVGVRALFAQAGVIACDGAEDLAETALLLAEQPLPAGPRVGVLSNAGGLGVLAADVAETQGLLVPELSARLRRRLARYVSGTAGTGNPVDAGAAAAPADFAALADLLLGGGEVDALLVLLVRTAVGDAGAVAATLPGVRRRHPDRPVVLVPYGGPSLPELPGVTCLGSAESALRALGRAARYAAWRSEPPEPELPSGRGCGEQARARALAELADRPGGGWLDTDGVVELLGAHDLAPVGAVARGVDAVVEAARETGYPVVLKVAAGAVVHRTERALVRVGVSGDDAVREVVREFEAAVADGVPVLVQPVAAGIEVALGLVRDPVLGPLAMVAAGGVNTDVWDDRVFLLPPIGTRDAARAVRSLRVAALLAGHRGAAAADVDALVALVVQLGCLAEEVPEIAELDLNPVLVGPAGCTVVDAKVRVAPGRVLDAGVPRQLRGRR
jgi:acyl-CoA synthetase (NDP forming)